MIRFLENRPVIVIVSTILLVGFFSLGMRFATADPIHQTHYNVGYNDGLKNAECDSKHAMVMGMIGQFQVVILLRTIMHILRGIGMGGIKIVLVERISNQHPMAWAG